MSISLVVFTVLALVYLAIWINAMLEAARAPVRTVEKVVWLGVIVVFQFFGTIAWYLAGPRPGRVGDRLVDGIRGH